MPSQRWLKLTSAIGLGTILAVSAPLTDGGVDEPVAEASSSYASPNIGDNTSSSTYSYTVTMTHAEVLDVVSSSGSSSTVASVTGWGTSFLGLTVPSPPGIVAGGGLLVFAESVSNERDRYLEAAARGNGVAIDYNVTPTNTSQPEVSYTIRDI